MEQCMMVSLCIIALNEEKNLTALLENVKRQDYDHRLIEVVMADSGSSDSTKQIMQDFKNEDNGFRAVKVLDNPGRIQASGWNTVIRASEGDLVIRIDAHALIPVDFVSANVDCIASGEYVCGGRRENITDGDEWGKKVLLMAETSMFGSGVAKYRNSDRKQYVKTVAHACYRKDVFKTVGIFNEKLLRSEDNELHYRIRKAGYNICMSDKIYSKYQTRATLNGMVKQKYGNGKWVGITTKISPKIFSVYHYIPALFVLIALACFALFVAACFESVSDWFGLPFVVGVAMYFALDIVISLKSCVDYGDAKGMLALPILFPLLHFAYGIGTLVGFIEIPFKDLRADTEL